MITIAWYENNGAADPTWNSDIATSADGENHVMSCMQIWMGMEMDIIPYVP